MLASNRWVAGIVFYRIFEWGEMNQVDVDPSRPGLLSHEDRAPFLSTGLVSLPVSDQQESDLGSHVTVSYHEQPQMAAGPRNKWVHSRGCPLKRDT